jgi:hypothetical protein
MGSKIDIFYVKHAPELDSVHGLGSYYVMEYYTQTVCYGPAAKIKCQNWIERHKQPKPKRFAKLLKRVS